MFKLSISGKKGAFAAQTFGLAAPMGRVEPANSSQGSMTFSHNNKTKEAGMKKAYGEQNCIW